MYKFILKRKKVLGFLILGLVVVAVIISSFSDSEGEKEKNDKERAVEVVSVAELNGASPSLTLTGEVSSQNEVDIVSQSAGIITSINTKLGSFVPAGFVLAEIENSAQIGRVLQAEAVVQTAEANLIKARKGARDEQVAVLQNSLISEEQRLLEARRSLIDSLNGAFILADDAIHNKVDQFISDPNSPNPQIIFNTPNTQAEINIESDRAEAGIRLHDWSVSIKSLKAETSNLEEASNLSYDHATFIADYLDKTANTVNNLTANSTFSSSDISTWKSSITTARTNMSSALSSITTARDRLSSREAAIVSAQKNLEIALLGEREEDIISVEAALKQARGSLQEARANLEKTLLRSPISGTVIDLSIERGNFVNTFTKIGKVANEMGLKITTFISGKNLNYIKVGSRAVVADEFEGVVTSISPAIDPVTRKVEVIVGVNEENNLINGQNISVSIERKVSVDDIDATQPLSIPISALKVGANENFVFTINKSGEVVSHKVVLGALIGDKIIIEEGVEPDMDIVVDARGLQAGDIVSILE